MAALPPEERSAVLLKNDGATAPVLVGITRGGGAPVYSRFTSTTVSAHREWIERILREEELENPRGNPHNRAP